MDGSALAELPRAARLRRAAVAMAVASESDGSTGGEPRLVTPAGTPSRDETPTTKSGEERIPFVCTGCREQSAAGSAGDA